MRRVALLVLIMAAFVAASACGGEPVRNEAPATKAVAASPVAGLAVGAPAGLDVIAGDAIHLADGRRIAVPVPAGHELTEAARVAGGWIAHTWRNPSGPGALWHLTAAGGIRRQLAADLRFGWSITPDGQTAFVGGPLRRIDLATGRTTGQLPASATEYHSPASGGPDLVIVRGGTGGEAAPLGIWDVRAGTVRGIGDFASMTRLAGGDLLAGSFDGAQQPPSICVTRIRVAGKARPAADGPCVREGLAGVAQSPSGDRLALGSYGGPDGAQVYEVRPRTGSGRPVRLAVPADFGRELRWTEPTAVLVIGNVEDAAGGVSLAVLRCPVSGAACEQAPLPAGVNPLGAHLVTPF